METLYYAPNTYYYLLLLLSNDNNNIFLCHSPLHYNILVYDVLLEFKRVNVQQIDVTTLRTEVKTIGFHRQTADRDLL